MTVSVLKDLWRGIVRSPGVSLATIVTIAVLAGTLIAVSAVAYNVLVSPWTYDSNRLGVIHHGVSGSPQQLYSLAPDEYRALLAQGGFAAVSASTARAVASGDGVSAARSLRMVRTTPSALEVTDAKPLLGRFIDPSDVGDDSRIVISHTVWHTDFNARQDVVGQSMLIDGVRHTIVGVMPRRFHFMGGDLWQAHSVQPELDQATQRRYILNFKLAPDLSFEGLQSRVAELSRPLARAGDTTRYPQGWQLSASRVIDLVVGPQRLALLLIVAGAAGLFMLGAINLVVLRLTREIGRSAEHAVRRALGESRGRSVLGLAAQCSLLALLGLGVAMLVGRLLFALLVTHMGLDWIPRELEGNFAYPWQLAFGVPPLAIALGLMLAIACWPVMSQAESRLASATGARVDGGGRATWALRMLSIAQIAIATLVCVVTIAIAFGARNIGARDLGFDPAATSHARLVFPGARYADHAARARAMDAVTSTLTRDARVESVGFIDSAPMQRYSRAGTLSGAPGIDTNAPLAIELRAVHGDVLRTLRLRLRNGRWFDDQRDHADSEPVVVVNRSLAQHIAGDADAVGMTVTVAGSATSSARRRVIGVIDDVKQESALADARPTAYVPYVQDGNPAVPTPGGQISLLLRTVDRASPSNDLLRSAIGAVDPWLALFEEETFEARASSALAGFTLAQHSFEFLTLIALMLAALCILVVTALDVTRRRREFAVRGAVGARNGDTVRLVLGRNLTDCLLACGIGVAISLLIATPLNAALQGAVAVSGAHMLVVCVSMLGLVAAAAAWPARSAARTNPVALLRSS